ncbi:MAG: antitoxin [Selenomonadaceae bacterium]|nr:antitoxin [Selenomonadaceae bacterium]
MSISDFIVSAVMEQIEDREDLKLYEKAEAEFNADPVTYSHEEVKKILVLTDDS